MVHHYVNIELSFESFILNLKIELTKLTLEERSKSQKKLETPQKKLKLKQKLENKDLNTYWLSWFLLNLLWASSLGSI